MCMNKRIQDLRQSLKLSQEAFGERIGLKKSAVSLVENGKNGTTDQTVKSICREFHVREAWLRTGEGEMYDDSAPPSDLEVVLKANAIDDLETELIKAYFELEPSQRTIFINHFKDYFARKKALQEQGGAAAAAPPKDEQGVTSHDDDD